MDELLLLVVVGLIDSIILEKRTRKTVEKVASSSSNV